MDDFDIYSDLPDFVWLKEEYEADVDVKKEELPTSEKDVIELKTKLLKLEKVHKLVLSHYSSLWKTAKQERKRMERQIAELRSQLDNLAFKRNFRQANHNTASFPVPIHVQPVTAFPALNNYQFNYPPPLISQTFVEQQISQNLYSYPPPPIHATLTNNQEQKQEEETPNEQFVDNLAVSSNVITPENSHGSDESEDEIVKKSEYRSTVYGERLRKKLLEERRSAAKQKKESLLNEKKVTESKSDHQNVKDSANVQKNENLKALKDKEAASMTQKMDAGTVTEENNNKKTNEIDAQNGNALSTQQELKNADKIEIKDSIKNEELHTESKNDIEKRQSDKGSTSQKDHTNEEMTNEDLKTKKERDLNHRKQDEQLNIERERDLERRREDESRIKQERDLERRRKEVEIEKAKREEQFEKRREEDIEKKRREQEVERNRKEESDRRRREEVNRRRRDEEIDKRRREEIEKRRKDEEVERRKKEEFEKRRREEIEKRRKDEEIERRKKEEIDKRRREEIEKRRKDEEIDKRREEIDKRRKDEEIEKRRKEEMDKRRREETEKRKKDDRKRKEEETERRRRDEIDKRRREEEAERRKKEEEQHAEKLKKIEKDKNEKQLKELIKERERIEQEMKSMKDEENEEGEITDSFDDPSCKKLQNLKEEFKETCRDKSKQSQKNQSDNRRNDDYKVNGRITRSTSSRVTNQMINDNRRKSYHEYAISKSDRHQDNHNRYDRHKHNDSRSRRDQLERERERRKSLHRNKSRNRNRSNSVHRSDEDEGNHSPKRIRLQENDRHDRDKLKDTQENGNSKVIEKSPKRRRQARFDERSPQNNKKRKMSPGKDLDCNIKSNKNDPQKPNVHASNKSDDGKNIIDKALSNENTAKIIESLSKDQDEIVNELTHSQKENESKDSNEEQLKHAKPQIDKKVTNHENKMKNLMNELFEVQEKPVGTSVNLKQVKNFEEISDETILTELEDGEISDSDESMNSENLPKKVQRNSTDKPTGTMNLFENNKFEIVNSENKLTKPLQKNNGEIASKGNFEIKNNILYNMLTENEQNIDKESSKIELHEKVSNKKEAVVFENNSKSDCNEIVIKTDNTSPQIISEKQTLVNETSHIECRVIESSETFETNNVKKNVLSEINENKIVSETNDTINTIIENEKQINDKKLYDSKKVEKPDPKNSAKCILVPNMSNILLEQPHQNSLKVNNSENKIDNKERLQVKRIELHCETNEIENTCLKENVNVNNDFINEHIAQSVINEKSHEGCSKPVSKAGSRSQDNAAEKSVNTSQTEVSLTTVKKIIVVRRRRRPVQLSDSPPVVVINNMK